jgi:hypothetical protein
MPDDLPALPLAAPIPGERTKGNPNPTSLHGPSPQIQRERLAPAFARLTAAFEDERLRLADDPAALEPEQILVLEVGGELSDFVRAVRHVDGLEFLAEQLEEKIDSDDDFTVVDQDGKVRPFQRQLFLVASDLQAWQQILSLWERFQRGESPEHGLTKFRDLFSRLKELRPWEDRDRLEHTGVLGAWAIELDSIDPEQLIFFEAELWVRRNEERREAVLANLRADLDAAGGEMVQSMVVEEIGYHGVLGKAPARLIREILELEEVRWMRTEGVRFFHAVGQIAAIGEPEPEPDSAPATEVEGPEGLPRLALLDGVPLANHDVLSNRIQVDDPDEWDGTAPVARRVHGTAMASLVVNGDLNDPARTPLSTPLYVRPILTTDAPEWVSGAQEELPRDRLPVDFVQSAVARIFAGDAPAAPDVCTIVLAVGDRAQQFNRFVSPLARLLDWLSFKYNVLFIVAAGNHLEDLQVPADTGLEDPQELQQELLTSLQQTNAFRRLLSPTESMNALTIGASHHDLSPTPSDDRSDGIVTLDLASPISALGLGIGRSVKPDVLFAGGRQLVRLEPPQEDGTRLATVVPTGRPPGVRVASPGGAGALSSSMHMTGTSVAAGLAGHRAGELLDQLNDLRREYGDEFPSATYDSVLLKAALVHGAGWGSSGGFLMAAFAEMGLPKNKDAVARFVGYGQTTSREPLMCDTNRVTVVGAAHLTEGSAHSYSFPLPPSLSSNPARRRITLTLAWLTPINPLHRFYRRAALKVEPGGLEEAGGVLGDRSDVMMNSARRGTLQHEVHRGEQAVPFAAGASLDLKVSCRAAAGTLDQAVPYALLASIEVPGSLDIPVYQEVRQSLRSTVRAARTRAR